MKILLRMWLSNTKHFWTIIFPKYIANYIYYWADIYFILWFRKNSHYLPLLRCILFDKYIFLNLCKLRFSSEILFQIVLEACCFCKCLPIITAKRKEVQDFSGFPCNLCLCSLLLNAEIYVSVCQAAHYLSIVSVCQAACLTHIVYIKDTRKNTLKDSLLEFSKSHIFMASFPCTVKLKDN